MSYGFLNENLITISASHHHYPLQEIALWSPRHKEAATAGILSHFHGNWAPAYLISFGNPNLTQCNSKSKVWSPFFSADSYSDSSQTQVLEVEKWNPNESIISSCTVAQQP